MIKCVIFCEFDVRIGPVLKYQYPKYISQEVFSGLSDILIPLPELCGKLITVHINDEDFVIGQPIIIFNEKYDRQKIEFNLAFVLPHEEYQRLAIYENFIRKIALHITALETFDAFLYNEDSKSRIEAICQEIFMNLTEGASQCYLAFDSLSYLILDYEKKDILVPPIIKGWQVPVPLADLTLFKASSTDLTLSKVINSIDGKQYVKEIQTELKLNETQIQLCLQHLYYQGLINFIDLFQMSNIYRITPKVSEILNDLADESVSHLTKSTSVTEIEVFNFYCKLSDKPISDFLEENPQFLLDFSIEVFIAYGLLKGIIRRIHKYCFVLSTRPRKQYQKNSEKIVEMETKEMLAGNTSMDEICTHFLIDERRIETMLKESCEFFNK